MCIRDRLNKYRREFSEEERNLKRVLWCAAESNGGVLLVKDRAVMQFKEGVSVIEEVRDEARRAGILKSR